MNQQIARYLRGYVNKHKIVNVIVIAMKTYHEGICKRNFHATAGTRALLSDGGPLICPRLVYKVLPSNFSNESREPRIVDATLCPSGTGTQDGRSIFDRDHTKGPFADDDSRFCRGPFFRCRHVAARDPN